MNVMPIALGAGVVLTLAACGSSTSSTMVPASSPASPMVSASAAASVDAATAGRVCAAVNAMTNALTGSDTGADAITTAASAYHLTQAQVVYAIDLRCPELKRIVPARA